MKDKIVCVEWEDASYDSGYYDPKDERRFNVIEVKTVGHIIKSDRTKIILAVDSFRVKDGDRDLRNIHTIPKKMIKRIRYLEDRR